MAPRNIVITGASSGIGAALAARLASSGRTLLLTGRDAQRLEAVAAACRAKGAACRTASVDVRDIGRMAVVLDDFDRAHPIDFLVANAGILDGRHADQTVEDAHTAREVLETNLLAAVDVVHTVLGGMRRRRAGHIVLVSSLAAFAPLADAPAYSASKAGLLSYGLGLRDALAGDGVNVTVACPGFVATRMTAAHIGPHPEEMSADEAARRILDGCARNSAVIGFPTFPYWFTRLCLLLPESMRRRALGKTRFHVAPPERDPAEG